MKNANTINSAINILMRIKEQIKFLDEDVVPEFVKGHEHEELFNKFENTAEFIASDAAQLAEVLKGREV